MEILYVKNMVCGRCLAVVRSELERLAIGINGIELGKVWLNSELNADTKQLLKQNLEKWGFELLENKQAQLIEQIKTAVLGWLQLEDKSGFANPSDYLSKKLLRDYSALSSLFSAVQGITIEKYIILQKIEKVKELLVYNELSLSEIAVVLDYSSVQHLSTQFKKITGYTVSEFKKLQQSGRKPLDEI